MSHHLTNRILCDSREYHATAAVVWLKNRKSCQKVVCNVPGPRRRHADDCLTTALRDMESQGGSGEAAAPGTHPFSSQSRQTVMGQTSSSPRDILLEDFPTTFRGLCRGRQRSGLATLARSSQLEESTSLRAQPLLDIGPSHPRSQQPAMKAFRWLLARAVAEARTRSIGKH